MKRNQQKRKVARVTTEQEAATALKWDEKVRCIWQKSDRCDNCGSDVQGVYITHPTFGIVRTCCARASE